MIREAWLEVTRLCNERCLYCYNDSGIALPDELSTADMNAIVEQFALQGGKKLVLTGGEPLLRSDLIEIARKAHAVGIDYLVLSTNGLLLNTKRGQEVLSEMSEVDISLDGFATEHDELRGLRSWDRTVDAIRTCIDSGVALHLNACLSPALLSNIDSFLTLISFWGVTSIKLASVGEAGRARYGRREFLLGISDLELYHRLERLRFCWEGRLNITHSLSLAGRSISPLNDGVVISPRGTIFPQLGLLPDAWQIGSAYPEWQLDDHRIEQYLHAMRAVTRKGNEIVARGTPVNWWELMMGLFNGKQ